MKAAQDAGVRSELQPNMANVLGTDYVTVLDMATAYATIAAQGVRANPYIVKEIRFQDKSVPTIKAKVVKQQVFDKDLMSDVIDAMTYPVEGGTARYVGRNLGRPAAGKTGTSESFRSAWFNGYVPAARDGRRPLPQRQGRRGAARWRTCPTPATSPVAPTRRGSGRPT